MFWRKEGSPERSSSPSLASTLNRSTPLSRVPEQSQSLASVHWPSAWSSSLQNQSHARSESAEVPVIANRKNCIRDDFWDLKIFTRAMFLEFSLTCMQYTCYTKLLTLACKVTAVFRCYACCKAQSYEKTKRAPHFFASCQFQAS